MINQHTAKSLALFLGGKVKIIHGDGSYGDEYILANIILWEDLSLIHEPSFVKSNPLVQLKYETRVDDLMAHYDSDDGMVVPILKTYDQLLKPMEFEGEMIIPIDYVYGNYGDDLEVKEGYILVTDRMTSMTKLLVSYDFSVTGFLFHQILEILDKLRKLGFGAVENDESPTGYVDIFTNCPCVRAE